MVEEEQRRFPGNGSFLLEQRDLVIFKSCPPCCSCVGKSIYILVTRAKGFICSSQLVAVAVSCPSGC